MRKDKYNNITLTLMGTILRELVQSIEKPSLERGYFGHFDMVRACSLRTGVNVSTFHVARSVDRIL